MSRNVYFNSPFLLGFEHLDRLLERTAKAAGDGYPCAFGGRALTSEEFEGPRYVRLQRINQLMSSGRMVEDLRMETVPGGGG